ncbi:MAG TPA: Holliday junction resolvase [Methanocorpusculum sp.]|nr:Holliday junction resolvase [Methanocorpusculum sp.]
MANEFERAVVLCINQYLKEHQRKGRAYRLKQSRFCSQYVDIVVDSLSPSFYLAIECKSVKGTRLSFTSNFHRDKGNKHQIKNISSFLKDTGRRGFLAVEFRGGQKNEAYLMPWEMVLAFKDSQASIKIDEFRKCIPLERTPYGYHLDTLSLPPSD